MRGVDMQRRIPYNGPRKCHGKGVLIVPLPPSLGATGTQPTLSHTSGRKPPCRARAGDGQRGSSVVASRTPHPFDVLPKNFRAYDLLWSIYQSSRR